MSESSHDVLNPGIPVLKITKPTPQGSKWSMATGSMSLASVHNEEEEIQMEEAIDEGNVGIADETRGWAEPRSLRDSSASSTSLSSISSDSMENSMDVEGAKKQRGRSSRPKSTLTRGMGVLGVFSFRKTKQDKDRVIEEEDSPRDSTRSDSSSSPSSRSSLASEGEAEHGRRNLESTGGGSYSNLETPDSALDAEANDNSESKAVQGHASIEKEAKIPVEGADDQSSFFSQLKGRFNKLAKPPKLSLATPEQQPIQSDRRNSSLPFSPGVPESPPIVAFDPSQLPSPVLEVTEPNSRSSYDNLKPSHSASIDLQGDSTQALVTGAASMTTPNPMQPQRSPPPRRRPSVPQAPGAFLSNRRQKLLTGIQLQRLGRDLNHSFESLVMPEPEIKFGVVVGVEPGQHVRRSPSGTVGWFGSSDSLSSKLIEPPKGNDDSNGAGVANDESQRLPPLNADLNQTGDRDLMAVGDTTDDSVLDTQSPNSIAAVAEGPVVVEKESCGLTGETLEATVSDVGARVNAPILAVESAGVFATKTSLIEEEDGIDLIVAPASPGPPSDSESRS
ncbi:hypothetical protein HDU96_001885, partial [Phlyctochytrium bullatum]